MRLWIGVALPLVCGLVVAGLLTFLLPSGEPLTLRLPQVAAPVVLGVIGSAFAAVGMYLGQRGQQQMADQLQQQREQFGRDRRRFVQRLDHEFKNPLMAIRAGVSNLQSAGVEAAQDVALTTVDKHTMRLVRLTTDLRKISELETRELESAEIDPTALLTEVADLIRAKAEDTRNMVLTVPQAPWPLPTIIGDWDLLFLAIYNLADNALKFSQEGDTVEIRAREEEGRVVIEVADTGVGISAEALPHVWEELYRGDNGHATAGSGLGLPLVKAIIERHNGSISLTSRSGQGTNVTVQLPKS